MGFYGGCRGQELHDMCVDDIDDRGAVLVVQVPQTKTHTSRSFTVLNEWNAIDIFRKYLKMRPRDFPNKRLFVNYRKGKCTKQLVGIHSLEKIPKAIAEFLGLAEPSLYTGHSFRRTSSTLLADGGADDVTMKRHGAWKSSSVVQGYLADSISNKIEIAKKISGGSSSAKLAMEGPSTSNAAGVNFDAASVFSGAGLHFHHVENCKFSIEINNNK